MLFKNKINKFIEDFNNYQRDYWDVLMPNAGGGSNDNLITNPIQKLAKLDEFAATLSRLQQEQQDIITTIISEIKASSDLKVKDKWLA